MMYELKQMWISVSNIRNCDNVVSVDPAEDRCYWNST